MSGVATAVIGSAVIGGVVASDAASTAAEAGTDAASAGINEQRQARQAFETRAQPFLQLGAGAGNELSSFLGLDPSTTTGATVRDAQSDIERLQRDIARAKEQGGSRNRDNVAQWEADLKNAQANLSRAQLEHDENIARQPQPGTGQPQQLDEINPLVSFLRDQGFEAIQESAAAGGRLGAGGTLKDLTSFNTNLAATVVPQLQNQRFNQLFNTASLGANTASGVGTAGQNTASNIGNLLATGGQAQAGGAIGGANAITGGLQNLTGALGAFPDLFSGDGVGPGVDTTVTLPTAANPLGRISPTSGPTTTIVPAF